MLLGYQYLTFFNMTVYAVSREVDDSRSISLIPSAVNGEFYLSVTQNMRAEAINDKNIYMMRP